MTGTAIPLGLCQCGCGGVTAIVTNTDVSKGRVRGQPSKYLPNHHQPHVKTPKTCAVCGIEFIPQKPNRQESQKTCSALCRQKYISDTTRTRRAETLRNRTRATAHSYIKWSGRHEHRVVAEWMLGRPLRPDEVVHHVDGNRRNNSPSNLVVCADQAEHMRLHAKGGQLHEVHRGAASGDSHGPNPTH